MNIFRFKKQIQNLFIFIVAILISFSIFPVLATEAQIIEPQGPPAMCRVYEDDFIVNTTSPRLLVSQSRVQYNEKFDIYFEAAIPQNKVTECLANGKDDYRITIYAYNDDWGTTVSSILGAYNYAIAYKVDLVDGKFRQKINKATLEYLFRGAKFEGGGASLRLYAYWHRKDEAPSTFEYIPSGGVPMQNVGTAPNPNPPKTTLPDIPGVSVNDSTLDNNETKAKADELGVVIKPDSSGKGLRSKYRVALTDTAITFGAVKGPDAIYADWQGNKIEFGQFIGIPYDSKGSLVYDYEPKFQYLKMYFADASVPWPKKQCWKDSANYLLFADDKCGEIVYDNDSKGIGSDPTKGTKGLLAGIFDPTMKAGIWSQFAGKTAEAGKSLGTVELYVIPIVWGDNGKLKSYVISKGDLKKIAVEVFKSDPDITAACKADPTVSDKTKCDDLAFAKFGFAETVTQTTASSEPADKGATQSLYAFIIDVISTIIIWLTAIIYKIFAYFVVPVINALLGVKPYQDAFVNIIYPGWLILRNLANIFFIIALLVVGLKILFQQSAAATARGFIMRLIIMALLVNFSLVIGQGIVGIADTVQSQFLPKNSRVIEALGTKLMVEPIQSFRTATVGETGTLKGDATLSDTAKPLVLLMLAVAAFFSFLAIAAFLAVRIVALLILYMVSPIAYVGFVMDETKGYAKKWWSEFLKYAFVTPILVFFLNIAALVATVTSSNTGNVIKIGDNLADDLVEGGLTIVTHFIVLLIIFAGMKFALSSGHAGAKTIVDAAQKGFKNTLTKWPGALKDSAANMGAKGLEKLGFGGAAKALTVAAKPLDYARAVKKTQWDDRGAARIKANQDRLNDTFLTRGSGDTSKMGSSLKKAKELSKDFVGDDAPYLRGQFADGYKKKNKDLTSAALMKMGQEGQFKDMLKEAKNLTGKEYSDDAAGLNEMTDDLVKKGAISKDNRRDLLNEFDKAAKKKKSNTHYGGNTYYNEKSKKHEVRAKDPGKNGDFRQNNYENEDSWVRAQIKARTGDDAKGSLKTDLTQTDASAAVIKDANTGNLKFTDAQIGVFAEQTDANLMKQKIWDAAEEANPNKFRKMQEAFATEESRTEVKERMIRYYNSTSDGGIDTQASAKADAKIAAINQSLFRRGGEQQQVANRRGEREMDQIGFIRPNNRGGGNEAPDNGAGDDDDEEDDDEEPQARTQQTTTARAVTMNPISSSQSNSTASSQASSTNQPLVQPMGDPSLFTGQGATNLSRGSTSVISNSGGKKSKNRKTSPIDEPRRRAGFTEGNFTTVDTTKNAPEDEKPETPTPPPNLPVE